MRDGHVAFLLYAHGADREGGDGNATLDDVMCELVVLEAAGGAESRIGVSFVESPYAHVGVLQRSSRWSVHLESGTPIAGIACVHDLSCQACFRCAVLACKGKPGTLCLIRLHGKYRHGKGFPAAV